MLNIILANGLFHYYNIIRDCGVIPFENIKTVIRLSNLEGRKRKAAEKDVWGWDSFRKLFEVTKVVYSVWKDGSRKLFIGDALVTYNNTAQHPKKLPPKNSANHFPFFVFAY